MAKDELPRADRRNHRRQNPRNPAGQEPAEAHGPADVAVNGDSPPNAAANGYGSPNAAANGHGPPNAAANGHGLAHAAANGAAAPDRPLVGRADCEQPPANGAAGEHVPADARPPGPSDERDLENRRGDRGRANGRGDDRWQGNRRRGGRAPGHCRGWRRMPNVWRDDWRRQPPPGPFGLRLPPVPPRPLMLPFGHGPMAGVPPRLRPMARGLLGLAPMNPNHRPAIRNVAHYWHQMMNNNPPQHVPVAEASPVLMDANLAVQGQINIVPRGHAPINFNHNQPPPVNMNPDRQEPINVPLHVDVDDHGGEHLNMAADEQDPGAVGNGQPLENMLPAGHQPVNVDHNGYPPENMARVEYPPGNVGPVGYPPGNMGHVGYPPGNMVHVPPNMFPYGQYPGNVLPNGQVLVNFVLGGQQVQAIWVPGWHPQEIMFQQMEQPLNGGQPVINMFPNWQAPANNVVYYWQPLENPAPDGQLPVNVPHEEQLQGGLLAPYYPPANTPPNWDPPEDIEPEEQGPGDPEDAVFNQPEPANAGHEPEELVVIAPEVQALADAAPGEHALEDAVYDERAPAEDDVPDERPDGDVAPEEVPAGNAADEEWVPDVAHDGEPAEEPDQDDRLEDEADRVNQLVAHAGEGIGLWADDGEVELDEELEDEAAANAGQEPPDRRYIASPLPRPGSPGFRQLVETDPVVTLCTAHKRACHCGSCRILAELPMELLIEVFTYLTLIEQMAAKVAFAGHVRVQQALGIAWRKSMFLDVAMFEEVRPMPPSYLDDMAASMPNLVAIRCTTNRKRLRNTITPSVIYEHCPYLLEIDLSIIKFEKTSATELCQRYPNLMNVRMPPEYTDEDMTTLVTSLPQLASLESGSDVEEGCSFGDLPPSLLRLSLTRCESLRSWNLCLVGRCTQLRELSLYARVGEAQLIYNLKERFTPIDEPIINSNLDPEDLTVVLASCPNLEKLVLAGGFRLVSRHFMQMTPERCGRLRELDLSRLQGLNSATGMTLLHLVAVLAMCPLLERLTMQSVENLNALRSVVPRQFNFNISHLDVSGSTLSDEFITELHDILPLLKSLTMRECPGISGGAMYKYIPNMLLLEELDIRGASGVTATCLTKLQRCQQLKTLWLRPGPGQCGFTTAGDGFSTAFQDYLSKAFNITTLEMLHLDLRRTGLSVASMATDIGLLLRAVERDRKFSVTMHADYLAHMEKPPPTVGARLQLLYEPGRYPGYESDSTGSPTGSVENLQADETADHHTIRDEDDEED